MSERAISFCLFGADPTYCTGALRNAELAASVYPGWRVVVYVGAGVPEATLAGLAGKGAVLRQAGSLNPMLARFLVNDDPDCECYIVRDTDSRLNAREAGAVKAWLDTGAAFHVIRDHPGHQVEMPGGLWGGRTGRISIKELLASWKGSKVPGPRNSIYNNDQCFLRECVWPLVREDCLQHDFCCGQLFPGGVELPARFGDWRFCGEVFAADEQPERYHWQMRMNWMRP